MKLPKPFGRFGDGGAINTLGPNTRTVVLSNSQFVIPAYYNRQGITVTSDAAGTAIVYGVAGSGVPSRTNFHFSISPGDFWDGSITNSLWSGQVTILSYGTITVGILEV